MITSLLLCAIQSPQGHAHNDYEHVRPFYEAIEHRFQSIEVDVFPVDGALWVGHDREELRPERTLKLLYLKPLAKWLQKQPPGSAPIQILVDIKADATLTYNLLKKEVAEYPELAPERKKVVFVLSGNRPFEAFSAQPMFGLDGRWTDRREQFSKEQMPLVSESWFNHFKWVGIGKMGATDRANLENMVDTIHREGRKIRFWGTPDSKPVWQAQWSAGVDWINTDQLAEFAEWQATAKSSQ